MDKGSNFDIHCTFDEAEQIARFITVDVMAVIYDCYCDAYKCEKNADTKWKIHSALDSVYMLGFLSGARAVRGARNNE